MSKRVRRQMEKVLPTNSDSEIYGTCYQYQDSGCRNQGSCSIRLRRNYKEDSFD